jgi:hypothetical protein
MARSESVRIKAELEKLQDNRGKTSPEAVVEFAKDNPKSALHGKFNWNVKEAAYQHWLDTARGIIRVYVTVLSVTTKSSRAFVSVSVPEYTSLSTERGSGGGYRKTVDVMHANNTRHQLLIDTIMRLISIKEIALFPDELGIVAKAIRAVQSKFIDEPSAEAAE